MRDEWTDKDDNPRETFKIQARRIAVLPVLPHHLERIAMTPKHTAESEAGEATEE